MLTRSTTTETPARLFLDHGADETAATRLHIEERGATFESPWEFPFMTELALCIAWQHPRLGQHREPLSGMVIGSRKLDTGAYETTVFFHGKESDEMSEFDLTSGQAE